MKPVVVIVGYKPKVGMAEELLALMKTHLPRLRSQDLVTSRDSILMRAKDGTIVGVFEWKSEKAIEEAHSNSVVREMWIEYDKVCTFVPVGTLPEASELFSSFEPVL